MLCVDEGTWRAFRALALVALFSATAQFVSGVCMDTGVFYSGSFRSSWESFDGLQSPSGADVAMMIYSPLLQDSHRDAFENRGALTFHL